MSRIVSFLAFVVLLPGLIAGGLSAAETKPAKPAAKPAAKPDPIPAEARKVLEEAGLKVTTSALSLPEEVEFGKSLREMAKQKKAMMAADRELYAAQRELDGIKDQIRELRQQHKNLSLQLVNVTNPIENNKIVGALNVITAEGKQLDEQSETVNDRVKDARKRAGEVRDEYIQELANLRTQAEEIPKKWSALAEQDAVKEAVEAINKALGSKFALQPVSTFVGSLKQLKTMEEAVRSEAIKLENETNSLWVNVTINDKHKKRMIVDSGASTISLPDKMARDMGIKADASGVPVLVSLADGRKVPGMMIKLDSVKVGKFTV
ncbi:MAG TPA: aspartyl protease family protein, partial [Isosphaeraceae bacterium]|nr:aspartyl protease family protein [Isosphaeraceae bacterium]